MRTDLDDLLAGSAGGPTEPIDADALWAAGRRRRALRRVTAVGGAVASIAAVAVVVGAMNLGGTASPEVAPLDTPGEDQAPTDDTDEAHDEAPAVPADDADTDEQPEASGADDPAPLVDDGQDGRSDVQDQGDDAGVAEEPAPAPTPDAALVADPCAPHQDREMEAFVEVVAPVTGQQVSGSAELVGCSSVYEGTVRYRVRSGDTILVDSFTTATAGGPEIGEFRETIDLDATGELVLEVFWESPADGSEQGLTTITFEAS